MLISMTGRAKVPFPRTTKTHGLPLKYPSKTCWQDKYQELMHKFLTSQTKWRQMQNRTTMSIVEIQEGLAVVKLTKETKHRIRKPQSKALIFKLYSRSAGFNYLQNKLNQLQKPINRLDCIDLGNGFFLVHFDTKDDLNAMLKKSPWFIRDHFLSIRPWEPFFKPSMTNVSLIVVWVRLNELPIELYIAKVFRQIRESIGRVLRIDTHTTMEAQGKYTRLCIQIDINKPLVNTILIGNFEQAVIYEGIQKLCFSCGQVGHRKEAFPFTICKEKEPTSTVQETLGGPMGSPRKEHEAHYTGQSSGMLEVSGMEEDEKQYNPSMVVNKKNAKHKGTRKGNGLEGPTKSVLKPVPSHLFKDRSFWTLMVMVAPFIKPG